MQFPMVSERGRGGERGEKEKRGKKRGQSIEY
jgi:hypothetical protein